MQTLFFVQPYVIRRRKLQASGALTFRARADAVAAGREAARSRAGVVVLSQRIDSTSGYLGKPEVIAVHGRVPEIWVAQGELPLAA